MTGPSTPTARAVTLLLFCTSGGVCAEDGGRGAAPLRVEAVVEPACDIGGGLGGDSPSGAGDFGRLGFFERTEAPDTALAMVSRLTIRCTNGAQPAVSLDYGRHARGTQRYLRGPGDLMIPYELRREAPNGPAWDDRFHALSLVGGRMDAVPIHGRILSLPPGLADGIYTDEVYITLRY